MAATAEKSKGFITKDVPTQEVSERQDNSSPDAYEKTKAIWDGSVIDPVLARKMALVNAAIDEIGMTRWHWKLFFLNGFGYAVDSV